MQHTSYSRQLASILALFGVIVFSSGSCFKTIEAVWSGSNKPFGGSQGSYTSYRHGMLGVGDLFKRYTRKCRGNTCCQAQSSNDKDELLSNHFKDDLLYALDHTEAFTKQEKKSIENVIHWFLPSIINFQDSGITPIEILEGIFAELPRDRKSEKKSFICFEDLNKDTKSGIDCLICFEELIIDKDTEQKNKCPICLKQRKDKYTALPCHATHAFHSVCLKKWLYSQLPPPPGLCQCFLKIFYLLNKPTCPMCRTTFNPNDFDLVGDYCWGQHRS